MKTIRLGTRSGDLAMAQAHLAADALAGADSDWRVEVVPLSTRGDRTAGPLADVGGKGLFTAELESALRSGRLDLAVHSAKDLSAQMAPDLAILAALPRGDARDALLSRQGPLAALRQGAKVGTSSLRRAALLRSLRSDVEIVPLRGNVGRRVRNVLDDGANYDATVLAMAGLARSGLLETCAEEVHPLDAEEFIPAAGQGTLVLQGLARKEQQAEAVRLVNHADSFEALLAERSVLRALRAGCHSCVAVHVAKSSTGWLGRAMVARPDGSDMLRVSGRASSAKEVAADLARQLLAAGADDRLLSQMSAPPGAAEQSGKGR